MFVVRLKRPNEDFDFKAFASGDAALARFRTAQQMMIDGEVEECALFEERPTDAAGAIAMINEGSAALIEANLDSDAPPQASAPTTRDRRSLR
ncbi:MAG: hypothetical protein Q7J60_22075 [Bradyrhizobium sp.]|nr:hypothetical protein [Bradyrhizobium sp.]